MGLFRKSRARHARHTKPTRAERRTAERTAQAEAKPAQTEQPIFELADPEVRSEIEEPKAAS
jgi:hypothetical protein